MLVNVGSIGCVVPSAVLREGVDEVEAEGERVVFSFVGGESKEGDGKHHAEHKDNHSLCCEVRELLSNF